MRPKKLVLPSRLEAEGADRASSRTAVTRRPLLGAIELYTSMFSSLEEYASTLTSISRKDGSFPINSRTSFDVDLHSTRTLVIADEAHVGTS